MLTRVSIGLISFYQQHIRGFFPESCRFNPTCSEYTRQAIIKFGFWRGFLKGVKRILSCHPFSGKSGYAPLE